MKSLTLTLIAALTLSTAAQANNFNTKSGLLLGIYASPKFGGMRVSSTIPGYSAEGVLHTGDILMRTTVDGWQMYQLRTHYEMENAKIAIGPNRQAAVEFFRPGVGLMYAWVEFTPIAGPAAAYTVKGQPQPKQYKAQFKLDGNARRMFQRQAKPMPQPGNTSGSQTSIPLPKPPFKNNIKNSAASLFNR